MNKQYALFCFVFRKLARMVESTVCIWTGIPEDKAKKKRSKSVVRVFLSCRHKQAVRYEACGEKMVLSEPESSDHDDSTSVSASASAFPPGIFQCFSGHSVDIAHLKNKHDFILLKC